MNWLSKIFNYVPRVEREGIRLDQFPCWKLLPTKDHVTFLKALAGLVPPDSVLYLEGGSPPAQLLSYLQEKAAKKTSKVDIGTIWPKPATFHVIITKDNMEDLSILAEHCFVLELAMHIVVYKDDVVLLSWYDAFDDPCYISREIPEDKVKSFCDSIGIAFEEVDSW